MLLKTESLTKKYSKRIVVDRLNLEVSAGEIYGFLGPNGAGKSTTIRMILGLVRPTQGKIIAFNENISKNYKWKKYVGAIIESPAFYPFLSGYENLRMFSRLSNRKVNNSDIENALKLVGLWGRHNDLVKVYSYGMKQRLGIACAILPKPELLILDEPSLGLDPQGMKDVRDILLHLKNDGVTIFLSSHLLSEVDYVCTSLGIIVDGKLLYQGSKNNLFNKHSYVSLRTSSPLNAKVILKNSGFELLDEVTDSFVKLPNYDDETIGYINELLVREGCLVYEIKRVQPTLEKIFLELVKKSNKAGDKNGTQMTHK